MGVFRTILVGVLAVIAIAVAVLALALSHNTPCGPEPATAASQPMKAAVGRCYGDASVVRIADIAKPVPGDHGVLIRVHAASVNPLDWHSMRGEPYPMRIASGWGAPTDIRLGTDYAGTVESVGKLVVRFKPGDEVFGAGDGAFGQYVLTRDSGGVAPKPANVTFEQAAAAPVAAVTALQALRDQGKLKADQRVLINGAGGGVGTFAVQIAKALGANVTAVTNSGSVELIRSLGADRVIDYTHEDFTTGAERYDLIVDLSGTQPLSAYRRVLTPTGTYVMIGNTDKGAWLGPLRGLAKILIASNFTKQNLVSFFADLKPEDLATVADLLQNGRIKPVIDRAFPFSQVADAIRYQETGHARGKVIVTVE